jgi:hypothetical protein
MFAKLLITAAVVCMCYLVLKARRRDDAREERQPGSAPIAPPLSALGTAIRPVAYGVLAVMLLGSGYFLYADWAEGREIVDVHVINPYTGAVEQYRARRGDLKARSFTTLEGHAIRIAEMERIVVRASE